MLEIGSCEEASSFASNRPQCTAVDLFLSSTWAVAGRGVAGAAHRGGASRRKVALGGGLASLVVMDAQRGQECAPHEQPLNADAKQSATDDSRLGGARLRRRTYNQENEP